ncbi:hypothetical protein SAMN05216327_11838 [Dyadobacter sp. SG02]|uniref:hypothetical protein n=1 Tax=Dyadobacter sp. SG02 TaxID=1855291 RepID=UPI0008B37131|nr:hypothetical protein [Dyadobacter sp. SG02]SEJ74633.1 hypothetical protein SAMN05216327_11838 [Dyadobacter sp. SG02]
MVALGKEVLKEVLKIDFAANRRSGKYLLLYNIYSEIIEGYPAHQAAQIISMDLGLEIKNYTIRRAKNAAEKQACIALANQIKKSNLPIQQEKPQPHSNAIDDVLNNYRPVGMEEKKNSNIIFHNKLSTNQ